MAKYDVKFSCGHVETIQLYGKEADRQRRIAWLAEHGECSSCYKKRIEAAHAAETAAAAAKAAEEKLPVLTGSEKQIAWALSIRAKKFEALNEMFANANANATDEQRQQNQIALQATKNVLASKTAAKFWIDNRNVESRKLIAQNGLQNELKAEFAKLTAAEAERNEVLSTPTVTTAAQEIAINAEISAATANNTADNIINDEHEQEAITMTITTTTNKAGRISGYYVDGVKTRKADIDFIINSRRDDIIVVDYHVGTEFRALTRSPYQLKVVLTGMEYPIMTQAAADELGYKIVKAFSGSYNGTVFVVEKKTDVDEYAINNTTTDVDDNDTDDEPINIDDATYRTILLHAEKISNGQNSFAAVLKNELRNLLNVDASELIEAIKTDSNYLNRVRCYLADFPIIITNDEGTRYHLVKITDDYCELDIINDELNQPPMDDDELQLLLDSVIGERTDEFNFTAQNGENFTCVLDGVFIKKPLRLDKFIFLTWQWRILSVYFTPTQVDKVIDMLREAIERGDTKFKFPTVDELNQPPMDTDLERKIKIEDSLRRAMEAAYAEHERFLRLAATSYNKGTRSDCFREADNELKLYNICWQATNELWSERW